MVIFWSWEGFILHPVVSCNRYISSVGAEPVAMKTDQKIFKSFFRQNFPRSIIGEVTFHTLAILLMSKLLKTILT